MGSEVIVVWESVAAMRTDLCTDFSGSSGTCLGDAKTSCNVGVCAIEDASCMSTSVMHSSGA